MSAVTEICSLLDMASVLRDGQKVISYSQFSRTRQTCEEKYGDLYALCFQPRVFLSFPFVSASQLPVIETRSLTKYLHEFERILQLKQELGRLGVDGRLTSEKIEEFTTRKLRHFYMLKAKGRSHTLAACHLAAQKFRFYHERQGYSSVEDVALGITSWELDKALRSFGQPNQQNEERKCNWFSDMVIFNILDAFLRAAGGVDAALDYPQFCSLTTFATFSRGFTQSLFDQLHLRGSSGSEMDLEEYARLVLAWNDRTSPLAVKYLFKIFDRRAAGYLVPDDLRFFVNETIDLLSIKDPDAVYDEMCRDVVTEILDMIQPSDREKITVTDVIKSKNGYEVFGMMADVMELYQHEHKDDQ